MTKAPHVSDRGCPVSTVDWSTQSTGPLGPQAVTQGVGPRCATSGGDGGDSSARSRRRRATRGVRDLRRGAQLRRGWALSVGETTPRRLEVVAGATVAGGEHYVDNGGGRPRVCTGSQV